MDVRARFEEYTRRLVRSVAARDDVEGLVLLGSTAEPERVDEWSDHDFYLVVREGTQERFRTGLEWLPDAALIAFAVRETAHGLKVVLRDGHMLEFAVASPAEVATFAGSPYVVALDRADVATRMAAAPTAPPAAGVDVLREFRLFLATLLIGTGRARRGEELAGGQLVRGAAVEHLARVLSALLAPPASAAAAVSDPFNALRRFEQAHPEAGEALGDALARPVVPCAGRLLDVVEEHLAPVWDGYPAAEVAVVRRVLGD